MSARDEHEYDVRVLMKRVESLHRKADDLSRQVSSHSKGMQMLAIQISSVDKKASQAVQAVTRLEQGSKQGG